MTDECPDIFTPAWEQAARRATLDKLQEQQWQMLTGDGSGTPLLPFEGKVPRVFLPTEPVAEEAPVEETQPPPSGWRDRPALL